jgi:hypothetical protein
MNEYRYSFSATCPTDRDAVTYTLTIEAAVTIKAERIRELCDGLEKGFHEDFADTLALQLGGRQTLSATHRGVRITTLRGAI